LELFDERVKYPIMEELIAVDKTILLILGQTGAKDGERE
jgi:hypothetical protein